MAALSREALGSGPFRVSVSRGSALPGDERLVVDPEATPPPGALPAIVGAVTALTTEKASVEVVVGGWRFVLDVEPERRARLRERAVRDRPAGTGGGDAEVRAIIPGRVVSVSVAVGDAVRAGQEMLVVEAMKMQNEVRAPRDGVIERLPAAAGQIIELGDLLALLGPPVADSPAGAGDPA